jgi:hypothetical protein
VKIGYSKKDPHIRAEELDCTGTPHPYEVMYDALLFEPSEVEQKVHAILEDQRERKEWFQCSIEDAIKAIRSASIDQEIIEKIREPRFTNKSRFIAYENETVLDSNTNLMWAAKDNGLDIKWQVAKNYCKYYQGGSYTNWRMPTLNELEELYNSGNYHNVITIADWLVWASENRDQKAACFDFDAGIRVWRSPSFRDSARALPVRSGK